MLFYSMENTMLQKSTHKFNKNPTFDEILTIEMLSTT